MTAGLDYFLQRSIIAANGCWVWQLQVGSDGYARCHRRRGSGTRRAGREAWFTKNGPIPDGLTIDHLCRNPLCVNPDHLEPVTQAENNRRALESRGPRSHCAHGHEYTAANTYLNVSTGIRYCRECANARARAYKARRQEVA